MSVSPITSAGSPAAYASIASSGGLGARPQISDKKQAAAQFEAIIIRQLLEPVMKPAMSAMGGSDGGSGAEIYGYMLTDAMATQLSKGNGLGLAKMLEKEFEGRTHTGTVTSGAALKLHPKLSPSNRE